MSYGSASDCDRKSEWLSYTWEDEMTEAEVPVADEKKLRDLALLVYVLQALGFVIGVTWIVAIIIDYVKLDDVRSTWIESHFKWQIKTFWFGLLGVIIGVVTALIVIGWLILAATSIWVIYRIVKGWLALNDGKPLGTGIV
jgi:uncharacterized membrane protein